MMERLSFNLQSINIDPENNQSLVVDIDLLEGDISFLGFQKTRFYPRLIIHYYAVEEKHSVFQPCLEPMCEPSRIYTCTGMVYSIDAK